MGLPGVVESVPAEHNEGVRCDISEGSEMSRQVLFRV
jgi:hypothetical protein